VELRKPKVKRLRGRTDVFAPPAGYPWLAASDERRERKPEMTTKIATFALILTSIPALLACDAEPIDSESQAVLALDDLEVQTQLEAQLEDTALECIEWDIAAFETTLEPELVGEDGAPCSAWQAQTGDELLAPEQDQTPTGTCGPYNCYGVDTGIPCSEYGTITLWYCQNLSCVYEPAGTSCGKG
jgi:hypothetical protein